MLMVTNDYPVIIASWEIKNITKSYNVKTPRITDYITDNQSEMLDLFTDFQSKNLHHVIYKSQVWPDIHHRLYRLLKSFPFPDLSFDIFWNKTKSFYLNEPYFKLCFHNALVIF